MLTRAVIEVFQLITGYASFVGIVPLKFISFKHVIVLKRKHKFTKIWFPIQLVSFIFTALQLIEICTRNDQKPKNLVVILYQGFLLISKMGALTGNFISMTKPQELSILLNCMISRPSSIIQRFTKKSYKSSSSSYTFLIYLIASSFSGFALFVIFIPLASFVLPCLYDDSVARQIHGISSEDSCETLKFRMVTAFVQFILMIPLGGYLSFYSAICLITLSEVNTKMKVLSILKNFYFVKETVKLRHDVTFNILACYYRQLQIFTGLCNECFQMEAWPAFQFCGCLVTIAMFYALLLFKDVLHGAVIGFLAGNILMFTFVVCFILDAGSRPMLSSKRFLKKMIRNNNNSKCNCLEGKISKRFLKSCGLIVFRMGIFHKMDRQRGPSYIRFILQRTFFLVVKTKLGGEFSENVVATLPISR